MALKQQRENQQTPDRQPATLAKDCREMAEVRAEIDRLDRQLVGLMAERQAYIEAAARLKRRAEEIRLDWRIEEVVAKVCDAADKAGLSKRIAEPVWRELIDRSIEHEHEIWSLLRIRNED